MEFDEQGVLINCVKGVKEKRKEHPAYGSGLI